MSKRSEAYEEDAVSAERPDPSRISELRTTFGELRERRRALMATLRASVDEMHSHSKRLRRESRSAAGPNGSPPTDSIPARLRREYGMTPREAEVALLLAKGLSNAAVAQHLGIRPHTARHHTQRVLAKLGVHSRAAAGARLRD